MVMETTKGNIELKLYDATPLHRDNFKMLVEEGAYDSLLFHRVIRDFMIQGGDPDSKYAEPGVLLGEGDRPYTIPAEFRIDEGLFQTQEVADSWFDRKFIKIVEGTTIFENVKDLEGTDYFCYGEGYTLAGSSKTYTSGGSEPSPTLNNHWFKQQEATVGNYMENGSYVDKRTFFRTETRGIRIYTQSYRKIYTVNQGVLEETERTLDSVWVLTGTIPPNDGEEILDPDA